LHEVIDEALQEQIRQQAALQTTPISLRMLYEYARLGDRDSHLRGGQFLHREMPIRLAKKVEELENIPGGLGANRHIRVVRDWYIQSFQDIVGTPFPRNHEEHEQFCETLEKIKNRHQHQVAVMARGIREFVLRHGPEAMTAEIQSFLDSFYLSRIGIRVLLGHHAACRHQREGWVGIICAQTSPHEVAMEAAAAASQLCRQTFGDPPPVRYHGALTLRFKYIPSHLRHMLFELFKNSFRATIEQHRGRRESLPSVHVVIAGGSEDVSIKVSDQGGGIPRSGIDKIWTYAYSTVKIDTETLYNDGPIMAGLGYGLPLSRLYARYFGGDLQVISLEGFGTDAFIHLSRLGTQNEYIL
jgi:pyruvate dehydrogenase kinase 2/3/4